MLTPIFLHGHLADKYGPRFDLDVSNLAEVISLLAANFSTFAKDVIGQNNKYALFVGSSNIGEDEMLNPINGQDVHIVPAVAGSDKLEKLKSNAAGFLVGPHMFPSDSKMGQVVRIVVGIVLIVVGVIFSAFGGYAWGVGPGMSLLMGGISDYITYSSLKKLPHYEPQISGRTPSYNFNGPVNTVAQGNPVPICYGRLLVGSQVISAQTVTI